MLTKTFFFLCSSLAAYSAPLAVRLVPNLSSPQPVGTVIGLIPRVEATKPGMYVYRYQVRIGAGPFRMIRDFSQEGYFAWSPELHEHDATVRVTVRNNASRETAEADLPYRITPRQVGSNGTITPTAHPLIALFSAPACPAGSQFRVAFRRPGDQSLSHTATKPCLGNTTNNVYVAGMLADADYQMRAEILNNGKAKECDWVSFHSGMLDGRFPPVSSSTHRSGQSSEAEGIVIRSLVSPPWRSTATDLDGHVVWYLNTDSTAFLTRVLPGGRFLVLADGSNSENDMKRDQLLRELDLAGGITRETNISRVAEQLLSRGIKSDCKKDGQQCVSGFHHEAIRLPNGHTIVLAGLERMFPAGTQDAKEPVDVLGDLILDLDEELQVAWVWNSFDHLDVKRAGLGKGKCNVGPGNDGCPPVFLAAKANEWLHSNSLDYVPQSGDLILSIPEQDWIVKIDYRDGKGNGDVVWRLGEGGDFAVKATDPYPWFSYQHDAGFDPDSNLLVLFDDGHRRKDKNPQANNRGQTWKLDEQARTATLLLNADVGLYSVAVGSAQSLLNGGYSFESGFTDPGPAGMGSIFSQTTETSADGKIVYTQQVDAVITYRSFRVPDMYTAPRK